MFKPKQITMKKKNILLIIWILLLVLTAVEYTFSEVFRYSKIAFFGIMLASFIKYIGVAFQFLELKNAHPFWKSLSVIIVLLFIIVITILYV